MQELGVRVIEMLCGMSPLFVLEILLVEVFGLLQQNRAIICWKLKLPGIKK